MAGHSISHNDGEVGEDELILGEVIVEIPFVSLLGSKNLYAKKTLMRKESVGGNEISIIPKPSTRVVILQENTLLNRSHNPKRSKVNVNNISISVPHVHTFRKS